MQNLDRYEGAIMGHAVGDSLGGPFEIKNATQIFSELELLGDLRHIGYQRAADGILRRSLQNVPPEKVHNLPPGFWTDDTAEMRCLAESLLQKGGFDVTDFFSKLQKWHQEGYLNPTGFEHIHMGTGPNTSKLLSQPMRDISTLNGDNDLETSNGGLMRALPIGLAYHGDVSEIKRISRESCYLTHNNELVVEICIAFNTLISNIIDGVPKEHLSRKTKNDLAYNASSEVEAALNILGTKNLDSDIARPTFDALNTFKNVLWAFQSSKSFSETIEKTIRIGGDTDTYAAIAGGLSGAFYGKQNIPERWITETLDYQKLLTTGRDLLRFNKEKVLKILRD